MPGRGGQNVEGEASRIDSLASSVSDGLRVDWDELEKGIAEGDRFLLRNLQAVARIGWVHRTLRETAGRSKDGLTGLEPLRAAPQPPPPPPGASLDAWGPLEVRGRLGGGAYGEVLRAFDPRLEREVALKLLHAGTSGRAAPGSSVIEEGRLLAKVRHPNVVTVFGAEEHEGRVGIWMELLEGRTLESELLSRGTFSAAEAVTAGIELCRALAAVHAAGLVHRDVKAQNVVREDGGRIVLMDLGSGVESDRLRDEGHGRSVSGTPLYMAPEVLEGKPATVQSDLYALGVLLWHLVTRDYPVKGRNLADLRRSHARRVPGRLHDLRPDLPDAFVRAVERALAKDLGERFATAGEMAGALARAVADLRGTPREEPGPRPAASRTSGNEEESGARAAAETAKVAPRGLRRILPYAGVTVALVASMGAFAWYLAGGPRPGRESAGMIEEHRAAALGANPAAAGISFRIAAQLYREDPSSGPIPLSAGDVVYQGDRLWMSYEASESLHVHLLSRDAAGSTYCLFSTSDGENGAPLPAGETLRIPRETDAAGRAIVWTMDDVGGEETLLLVASMERDEALEKFLADVPRPPYVVREERTRGVSHMESLPESGGNPVSRLSLDSIRTYATRKLEARRASGVYVEEIVLRHVGTVRPLTEGGSPR